MKAPKFSVVKSAATKKARIEIYDDIGPSWAGMIDTKLVANKLAQLGDVKQIQVRINSRGGDAWEGLGIANLLKEHDAKIEVVVDGIAASAASLIAMAGDSVRVPKNSLLMIHEPWTIAAGYADDFRKAIASLEATTKAGIALYAAKSGKSEADIAAMLKAETWLTGEEAVEAGFADSYAPDLSESKAPVKEDFELPIKFMRDKLTGLAASPISQIQASEVNQPMAEISKPAETPAGGQSTATPALTKADVEQAAAAATQAAVAGERKRVAELNAICQLAGKPTMTQAFIENGTSVEDARKQMYELVCKERKPSDGGQSSQELPPTQDADAKYKAEYAAEKASYMKAGVSEAEYVKMRRIDDGVDKLTTKSAV